MNNRLYTIQEVADILGVSTKTLRRWDQRGRFVPTRTAGNQRRYTQQQIQQFKVQSSKFKVNHSVSLRSAPEPASNAAGAFFKPETPKEFKPVQGLPSALSSLPSNSFLKHHFLLKHRDEIELGTDSGKFLSFMRPPPLKLNSEPSAKSSAKKVSAFKIGFMFAGLVLILSFAGAVLMTRYNLVAGLAQKKEQFAKLIANLPQISISLKPRDLSFAPQNNQAVLAAETGVSDLILNVNVPAFFSQSVGIGTTAVDPSAILDISAEDKGFLAPRMTTVQRDAITSPTAGLFVYNTDTNHYNMYNGTAWQGVFTSIGDSTLGEAFTKDGKEGNSLYFHGTGGGNTQITAGASSGTSNVLTFPDTTGTFITTGNLTAITKVGTVSTGVWNGTVLTVPYGGTGVSTLTGIVLGNGSGVMTGLTTSVGISGAISDETGTGALVFGTSPAITTSLTTASTTFALINTAATTVNFAGAATTLSVGAATGTTTINNATTAITGALTANGDVTLGDAITDNITFTGRVAQDSDLLPIGTTGTNDLGSSTLPWDNLYANNVIAGGTSGIFGWLQRNAQTLSPTNITDDFLLGGISTASAKFGILNIAGGNPTATMSSNLSLIVPTGNAPAATFNLLNNGTLNFQRSPGGDAGLATAMFVSNNGNIGIGTTAPGALLHVRKDVNDTVGDFTNGPQIMIDNPDAATDGGISAVRLMRASATKWAWVNDLQMNAGDDLTLWGQGGIRPITVKASSGNVGIGNTTPLTALDVTGSASLSADLSLRGAGTAHTFNILDNGTLNFQRSAGGDGGLATALFIQNNGNIGIGTTGPSGKLEVTDSSSDTISVLFKNTKTGAGTQTLYHELWANNEAGTIYKLDSGVELAKTIAYIASSALTRITTTVGSTDAFTIKNDGNVGIGNTTPLTALDVAGSASLSADLSLRGAGTAHTFNILDNGTLNFQRSPGGDAGLATALFIQNNGNVGIGNTAPGAMLSVGSSTPALISSAGLVTIANTTDSTSGSTGSINTLGGLGVTKDLAVDGGDMVTGATTFNLINTTATTLNIGGAATTLSIGAATGTVTLNNATTAITGALTANGDVTLGDAATDNITFTGRVAQDSDLIPIGTTGTNDLGSSSFPWDNLYADNIYSPSSGTSGYWQRNAQALSPTNITDDLLLGATSTASAKFGILNMAGGNPTATMSSNLSLIVPTGNAPAATFNLLNNGTLNIQRSPGGDAGLTTALFIQNNGNVGIGTTAPTNKLTVDLGAGQNATGVLLTSSGTEASLQLKNTGTGGKEWQALSTGGSAGAGQGKFQLYNSTDAVTPFIVTSAGSGVVGNVGLGGQTSPLATLDVTGSASLSANLSLKGAGTAHTFNILDNGTLNIQRSPGGDAGLATALFIQSNGSVGIGNTAPGAMLSVGSSTPALISSAGLLTVANTTDSTSGSTGSINTLGGLGVTKDLAVDGGDIVTGASTFNLLNATATTVNFAGAATTFTMGATTGTASIRNAAIHFPNATAVGIGMTNPLTALDVTGSASLSADLSLRGAGTAHLFNILQNGTLNFQRSAGGDAGLTSAIFIQGDGNVGIGTTAPAGKLDVRESGAKTDTSYGEYIANTATSTAIGAKNKYGLYVSSTGAWNTTGGYNYGLFVDATGGGTDAGAAENGDNGSVITGALKVGGVAADGPPNTNYALDIYGSTYVRSGNLEINGSGDLAMTSGTGKFIQTFTGTTTDAVAIVANSLTSGNALDVSSSSTAALTGDALVNLAVSGANAASSITRYALYAVNTATGTTSTNVGGYFSASGATNNYGLIVDSGNVGIGNTTPLTALDVTGSASLSADLSLRGAGTAHLFNILQNGTLNIQRSPGGDAGLATALFIQSNGNVGIGVTAPETKLNIWNATAGSVSPIANTLLTIENDNQAYISLLAPDTQDTGIVFGGPTGNARGMVRYYNNTSALPDTMTFTVGNASALQLSYPSGILAAFQAATTISTPINTSLTLSNTGTGNIILSPGGNVGIGNTTPLTALDVTGSASLSANLSLKGAGTAHTFNILDNGTLNIQRSPGGDAGLATALFIQNNGNVGIGTTSPGSTFEVAASKTINFNSSPVSNLTLGTNLAAGNYSITSLNDTSIVAGGSLISIADNTAWYLRGSNTVNRGGTITLAGSDHAWTGKIELSTPNAATDAILSRLSISGNLTTAVATWSNVTHTGIVLGGTLDTGNQWISGDGGAEGLMIDDSGNVGIGTTSPNNRLEVLSTTTPQFRVAYDTSNYLTQAVSNAGAVTLDATGTSAGFNFSDKVGIGKAPVAGQTLTVAGQTASGTVAIGVDVSDTFTAAANSDNLFPMNIGGGNVFASVTYTGLEVRGLSVGGASWTKTGTGTITNASALWLSVPTIGTNNYGIYQSGAGNNYFGGNVGIGNTTPLTALDVTGSASLSANLSLRGAGTAHTFNILDNGTLNFQRSPGGDAGLAANSVLFLGNNGNVGIGTTGPVRLLHIKSATTESSIIIENDAVQWKIGNYDYGTGLDSFFVYGGSSASDKLVINPAGNVGIGDTGPDYLLELYDATNTPAFALSDDDIAHGVTTLAETDVFGHLSSISTTVGGLQVTGLADATGIALGLKGVQSSNPTDTTPAISLIGAKANGTGVQDLAAAETVFQVANNDDAAALTILGDGKVGIGTATPTYQLQVGDSAVGTSFAGMHVVTGDGGFYLGTDDNNILFDAGRDGTYDLTILGSNKNVGIGNTTPLTALDVTGSASLSADLSLRGAGTNHLFNILQNGTLNIQRSPGGDAGLATALFIQNNGNVGIGTTTPSEKLEVSGNIAIGSNLLKTTNLAIQEADSNFFEIRNAADNAYRRVRALQLRADTFGANTANPAFYLGEADGEYGIFYAHDTGGLDIEVARGQGAADPYFSMGGSQEFKFYNSGVMNLKSNALVIDSSGNVGINNSTPLTALDVTGSASLSANLSLRGAGTAHTFNILDNGTLNIQRSPGGDAGLAANSVLYLGSNGSVGIGITAPTSKLDVYDPTANTQIRIRSAGADSAPALQIANDVRTWQMTVAGGDADKFKLSDETAGLTRLTIDSSGLVGIRTTSPTLDLDIRSSAANSPAYLDVSNSDASKYLVLYSGHSGDNRGAIWWTSTETGLSLGPADSLTGSGFAEKLTILTGGNVGIGNTAPLTALDVTGSASLSANLSLKGAGTAHTFNILDNGTLNFQRSPGGDAGLASALLINSAGSVVFGNALLPAGDAAQDIGSGAKRVNMITARDLTLTNSITLDGGTVSLPNTTLFVPTIKGGSAVGSSLTLQSTSAVGTTDFINFKVGNNGATEAMRIIDSGNVGIGTTTPAEKLHLWEGSSGGTADGASLMVIEDNTNAYLTFLTPSANKAGILWGDEGSGVIGQIIYNHSDNHMEFTTNTAEQMRITSAGLVGIGTTAPLFKLDVQDSQTATAAAMIYNTSTGTDADGLAIKLGFTGAGTATNLFTSFLNGNGLVQGLIKSNASSGVTYQTNGVADFAEYFEKDQSQNIPFGSVVCFDGSGLAVACDNNSNKIVGVASEHPAFLGGDNLGDRSVPVGLVGQVKTRVSTANGEIKIGDPLTTSSTPGVAVKATQTGQILGKAIEGFNGSGEGSIRVSVNISWYNPSIYVSYDGTLAGMAETVTSIGDQLALQGLSLQDQIDQIASSSASINYVLATDPLFDSLNNKVANLQAKVDLLSSQAEQQASTSAFLMEIVNSQVLGASTSAVLDLGDVELNNAVISDSLNVLGRTTVTDLGVTGNINAGLLAIHGIDGEIGTLAGDLYLQKNGIGGVNILDGKVVIDTLGNMTVAGTVTADAVEANTYTVLGDQSIGSAAIPANALSIEIFTSVASSSSKIFLTSTSLTDKQITVISKSDGRFKVAIPTASTSPITFDWWIVGNK